MAKKNKKVLYINTNQFAKYYGNILKKENPKLYKEITKLVNKVKRDINAHFKKDKWDLDYDLYKEDVVSALIGSNAYLYLTYLLTESKNYSWVYKNNSFKFVKKKNGNSKTRRPI